MTKNYSHKAVVLLLSFIIPFIASAYDCEVDGIRYNLDKSTQTASVTSGNYSGIVHIPEKINYEGTTYRVTEIGDYAFSDCRGLTSITIPNSVTNIGSSAFYGCWGLTEITIPNSVTNIGKRAFVGCSDLTELTIPNSVTSIGEYAFLNCSGLISITIPNSVINIGDYAFSNCSGLTGIDVDSDNPNYASYNGVLFSKDMTLLIQCPGGFSGSFVIPNSVTNIGERAFWYCSGLTSITIPNSVTNIGERAFQNCSGLTSIDVDSENPNYASYNGVLFSKDMTLLIQCPEGFSGSFVIPNSVTNISDYAFWYCSGLTNITIPNSVTNIGEQAFSGCSGLTSVYYNTQNPITSDEYLFSNYSATLYVPKGAVDTFKATTPWNKFNKIEEYDFGGVADAIADKSGEIDYTHPYEIYNFNGAKVGDNKDTLTPGLYIIRQGTTTKKISVQ